MADYQVILAIVANSIYGCFRDIGI